MVEVLSINTVLDLSKYADVQLIAGVQDVQQ